MHTFLFGILKEFAPVLVGFGLGYLTYYCRYLRLLTKKTNKEFASFLVRLRELEHKNK